jgi:hypothetical protein
VNGIVFDNNLLDFFETLFGERVYTLQGVGSVNSISRT